MDEVELKYRLDLSGEQRLRDLLVRSGRFGSFDAVMTGEREYCDTYFDRDGMLRRLGWSLRIRESADGVQIALKVPRDGDDAGAAIERQEIENTSIADVKDVLTEIVARLRKANVLAGDGGIADVLSRGLFGVADALGLTALFSVRTSRTMWQLTDTGSYVAELVLDGSRFAVGSTEELPEYQMEIELADRGAEAALAATAHDEHGLRPTHETKFQRGLVFHTATQLHEQVEVKLDLPGAAAYAAAARMLSDDPGLIRGYQILGEQGVERHIRDVYYDTATLDLARAHCYLRIRQEENGDRKLVLRRVGAAKQGLLPVQEEFKGFDAHDDFASSWRVVAAVAGKLLGRSAGDGSSGMAAGLRQLGLVPSLTSVNTRLTWVVQPVGDAPDAVRQIAKIKLDDVTFDDGKGRQQRHAEIEITGLEDHESAPGYLDQEAFRLFMSQFRWTCAQRVFRSGGTPELHIGTKYHTGLRLFGRIDDTVAAFPGNALIRQESAWTDFEPEVRSSLLSTIMFFALSMLGLAAFGGARSSLWEPVLLGVGGVLLLTACLVLVRDRSTIISWRTRKRMVVAVTALGVTIIAIRFGSKPAADLVGLIGFPLTVLGLLALNSRESTG